MKQRVFWKILTMALVLGAALALVACGDGNGGGGGNASIGETLNLSGPVYTQTWDNLDRPIFTRFTGSHQIRTSPQGIGTGSITGGNLSFTAGIPPASALEEWEICDECCTDDQGRPLQSISPPDTLMVRLDLEAVGTGGLWRGNETVNQARTTWTEEGVGFIYVNQDATWTGRRHVDTETDIEDGVTYTYTWTQNAFTINLRQGWNAVHFRETWTETATSSTGSETVSAGNPGNLRWILERRHGEPDAIVPLGEEEERPGRALRARAR